MNSVVPEAEEKNMPCLIYLIGEAIEVSIL